MKIKPLRQDFIEYLKKHQLVKKYNKQSRIFQLNPRHPSLHTELLEPKELKIYSIRIDKHYRAIFIFLSENEIEVVDINNHYG